MFESVVCEHMPKTATARNKATTDLEQRRFAGQKNYFFSREWVGRETGNRNYFWCGRLKEIFLPVCIINEAWMVGY